MRVRRSPLCLLFLSSPPADQPCHTGAPYNGAACAPRAWVGSRLRPKGVAHQRLKRSLSQSPAIAAAFQSSAPTTTNVANRQTTPLTMAWSAPRFSGSSSRPRGAGEGCNCASGCYCEMQCVRLRVSCACHGRRLLLRACSDWRTLAGLTVQRPPISHAACSAKVTASNTIQFGSVFKLSDCPAPLLEHRRRRRSVRAFLLNHCLPACLRPGPGHPTGAPGPGRCLARPRVPPPRPCALPA